MMEQQVSQSGREFDDVRRMSGIEIGRLIRAGELSSRDAVEAHIAQLERVNPAINAVVATRFDEARQEAAAADRRLAGNPAGDLPPYFGVPCTIKECFRLTGMPNTSGLVRRKSVRADGDATTVARMRAAGAIPLGVTNTSELCMWMESANQVYGRTNNPYDLERIVGGSSGGEGAIIAAGASPLGLGSDIGGSIRGPAFFNGIFGHKGTGGLVPNTGQHPIAAGDARRYLCSGPMTRRAADLFPLLKIMAGPDGEDGGCVAMPLGDPERVDLTGRTLVNLVTDGRMGQSSELLRRQNEVAAALKSRGMKLKTVELPELKHSFDIWSAAMHASQEESFAAMLGEGTPVRPLREIGKWLVGSSDHTLMASLLAVTDVVPKLLPGLTSKRMAQAKSLQTKVDAALGEDGVLLYPSYTTVAPRHGVPVLWALRLHMPWAYLGIINILGLPATQVPLGLDDKGVPLGVQVISAAGNDHVTIRIAQELERDFGGWVPPKLASIALSGGD